ncbi:Acetylesterase [Lachnellula cervina]|uniref:Acetylesterase n=1 Tax=Lachnellula cervina TaxID=1316786 RepID=A0A7D8YN70_9HELO|nr:Acetylesterase [Lachnellula cervina]
MQFLALALLAASVVVVADTENEGHHGGTKPWVKDFKNLVAFGDSYTDESRLNYFYAHNGSAPPPGLLLPENNFTSGGGFTWDRWVSNYTGAKLYNYAVSGAVCDNNIIYRYLSYIHGPFPDVVYEVDAFKADIAYINASTGTNTLYTDRKADNTVYSMWIGTNDLGDSAFMTDSQVNHTTIPDYIDCIYDRFDSIYAAGGRYFVLMNTAPLELSPLYGLPEDGGLSTSRYWPNKTSSGGNVTEISYKMKEYTQLVNTVFDYRTPYELLVAKRYPGASIAVFDTNAFLSDVYYHPDKYLTAPANVTGAYWVCNDASACTASAVGLDHYLWYDDLHPSEKTDEAIAHEFVSVVTGTSKFATYW